MLKMCLHRRFCLRKYEHEQVPSVMLTSYTELPLEDLTSYMPSFACIADIESAGTFLDLSMLAMHEVCILKGRFFRNSGISFLGTLCRDDCLAVRTTYSLFWSGKMQCSKILVSEKFDLSCRKVK